MFGLEILYQETGSFSFYRMSYILLVCLTNLYIDLPPHLLIWIQNLKVFCYKELPNTTTLFVLGGYIHLLYDPSSLITSISFQGWWGFLHHSPCYQHLIIATYCTKNPSFCVWPFFPFRYILLDYSKAP